MTDQRPHQADANRLRRCGELIYGVGWQSGLARLLGAYHPDGARESIDVRYVRRVAAGERPAIAWWWQALRLELRYRRARLVQERRAINEAIDELPPSSTRLLTRRAPLTLAERAARKHGAAWIGGS